MTVPYTSSDFSYEENYSYDIPHVSSSTMSNEDAHFNFTELCICSKKLDNIHKKIAAYCGEVDKDCFIQYVEKSDLDDKDTIIKRIESIHFERKFNSISSCMLPFHYKSIFV